MRHPELVSGSHQIGPMGEMLNRFQHDSLFQFSKNVRDKFLDLTMLESMPRPGLRPEEGAPAGQLFFRRVGVPADRTWQAGRLPYDKIQNPISTIFCRCRCAKRLFRISVTV